MRLPSVGTGLIGTLHDVVRMMTKGPLLSVDGLVDRRGLEPLTSAVQGRRSPS